MQKFYFFTYFQNLAIINNRKKLNLKKIAENKKNCKEHWHTLKTQGMPSKGTRNLNIIKREW